MGDSNRKLVLVVHGVGEQQAGSTLDNFVGAVTNNVDGHVETERVILREDHAGSNPRARETFPCPTRHVVENESGNETLFAEVHWADLSKGPTGVFSTLLEGVKTVLGLGYVVRANVREVHEPESFQKSAVGEDENSSDEVASGQHTGFWTKFFSRDLRIRAADIFVWLAHGPNAVLNLLLALGVLLTYGVYAFFPCDLLDIVRPYVPHGIFLSISAFGVLFGLVNRPVNRLFRQCADWMFFFGLAGFAYFIVIAGLDMLGRFASPEEVFDFYILSLIKLLQISWLIMLLIAGVLVFLWVFNAVPNRRSRANMVYPQSIAAMAVLWMIFACTFWVAFGKWAETEKTVGVFIHRHLEGALGLLSAAMISFMLLIIYGLLVLLRRLKWVRAYRLAHMSEARKKGRTRPLVPDLDPTPSQKGSRIPRLLMNARMGWVLSICLLGLTVTAVLILLDTYACVSDEKCLPDSIAFWRNNFNTYSIAAASVIGTLAALVFPAIQHKLAVGLGVGKDVINYFVDCMPKRSPIGSFRDMRENMDADSEFELRQRINQRFSIVMETLVQSFDPHEILVISHSQGTMISILQLADDDIRGLAEDRDLKLVTMGSPFSHLYHYYFPSDFNVDHVDDALLKNWTNIYRVDDFVGTFIYARPLKDDADGEKYPVNIPIHPFGHTGYWFDQAVLDILKDRIGLSYKSALGKLVKTPDSSPTGTPPETAMS